MTSKPRRLEVAEWQATKAEADDDFGTTLTPTAIQRILVGEVED